MRALVVDDSAVIVAQASRALIEIGFETVSARNGEEAYDAFRQSHFDLVLTDITMPVCDGITLTSRIRAVNSEVPVVMLTAADDPHYIQSALDAGANAYLLKPLDENALRERLESLLPAAFAEVAAG